MKKAVNNDERKNRYEIFNRGLASDNRSVHANSPFDNLWRYVFYERSTNDWDIFSSVARCFSNLYNSEGQKMINLILLELAEAFIIYCIIKVLIKI